MLILEDRYLKIVKSILKSVIPEYTVWAFGSRVHGENLKPFSDLDLAVRTEKPIKPQKAFELKEAFSLSSLPFKVDIVDWVVLSDEFKSVIASCYVLLQEGSASREDAA